MIYVDDLTKHSDSFSLLSKVGVIAHKSISVPCSRPGEKPSFDKQSFSPARCVSPAKGAKSSFINRCNLPQRGVGVSKVLTELGSIEMKEKNCVFCPTEMFVPRLETFDEVPAFETEMESSDCTEDAKLNVLDRAWLEGKDLN